MRAPVDTIAAPPLPPKLPWINVGSLRMDRQIGRPVLIEFWDFCRPHSLRTLPYVKAWHERYQADGLRVIGVHCPGFSPSHDERALRAAVTRLGISHPVAIDEHFAVWAQYGNEGWPARYLFDQASMLSHFHYGEGAYAETEQAIQELLGVKRTLLRPVRPEDAPGAVLAAPSPDREGAWSGPYQAGGVWAVLEGAGSLRVNARELAIAGSGAHPLIEHARHTSGTLELELGRGLTCHAVCFTPGLAEG